jgi:ferric-dicitrate binding protein FerR (iron transport regulator)
MFNNFSYRIVVSLLLVAGGWHCADRTGQQHASTVEGQAKKDEPADTAIVAKFRDGVLYENGTARPRKIRLGDGSDILLSAKTKLRVSREFAVKNRDVQLDGEAFFDISGGGEVGRPFTIYTRSLQIFVLGTRLRVDAFADNAGEEVDLLSGKVKVIKSYHSTTDNEPEILQAGEMVMINRDIDLMEKEKLDSAELKKLQGGD